ncbi:MAG: hypothetical protein ACE5HO_19530 [bacterium]
MSKRNPIIKLNGLFVQVSLWAFVVFTGCSGLGKLSKKQGPVFVPAGVDTSIAVESDSLADELFVSLPRKQKADKLREQGKSKTTLSDTLWVYLSAQRDSFRNISEGDSLQAIDAFNAGALNLQALARLQKKAKGGLTPEVVEAEVKIQLELAKRNFERALVLNPFDLETRSWLARVYQSLAVKFVNESNHKKAIQVLENLVRLEKGEHTLYARLAESYYAIEDWQAAYDRFSQAEAVLRQSRGLDFSAGDTPEEASIDTSALFYYVYYQGDTEAKLHQADRALIDLDRAMKLAATEQEEQDIRSYVDWINWDDGNVGAVELRDKCLALVDEEKYKNAAKWFKKLLGQLRTKRASDEISWRLALLEFQYLNRKNEGIDRLKQVVKLVEKDEHGAPADSTYQKYFNSYGVMCHNLGLEYSRKNRKIAFTYFKQSAAIDWENKAKSYLEIAKLSRNNPKAVLKNCEQAIAAIQQLDQSEQMQTYQLMVEASKRLGKFDQARTYFAQWVGLRRNHNRSSSK